MSRQLVAANIAVENATQQFTLGAIGEDEEGNVYQYMQANGAKVAYNLYSYHPDTGTGSTSYQVEDIADATVTPGDAESLPICCPQIAIQDDYFAWVFVGPGTFTGTSGDAIAVDTKLYLHATAGAITDGATAALLNGVSCPVVIGSATTGKFFAAHRMYAEDLP